MKIPATLLLATLPVTVFGLGFRLTDINTEATARGGAFAATADNASAIYYNPAGITQLDGTQALFGAYTITYESSFNSHLPGGSNEDTKWSPQSVPSSFITINPKDSPIALGLGVYSPFGLGLEYNDDAPFRTLAKKGKLQFITISPVAAWKFGDTLSIAAGPTINFGR
ncbi:MAG: outer membrane protein transport protein, partial [Chthoniobacteraceae bacterium]